MKKVFQKLCPVLIIAALASCGGGGSGSSTGVDVSSPTQGITIGGTVAGFVGSFSLSNNNGTLLVINSNGTFSFPSAVDTGDFYNVVVSDQPADQVCSVVNSSGQAGSVDITNIAVACIASTVTVTLSGSFTAAILTQVDSDINDPFAATNVSNDSFDSAQPLFNFATVNGFATKSGTQRADSTDRFKSTPDEVDIYTVSLQAKQSIRLQVVNFQPQDDEVFDGDLDLKLYDANLNVVDDSDELTEYEVVQVPADGQYFIAVTAFSGTSKYVLSLDAVDPNAIVASLPEMRSNEAIVKFSSSITAQRFSGANNQIQMTSTTDNQPVLLDFSDSQISANAVSSEQTMPTFLLELSTLNSESFERYNTLLRIKTLNQRDDVEYAEPNFIRRILRVPNDTEYGKQWHYPAINLPQAWDITTGTPPNTGSVIVAVADTGVFLAHPDFAGQLVSGYDFISDISGAGDGDGIDSNPDDPGDNKLVGSSSWHGTHVAGTVAAKTNNGSGVAGVSWGAKIMPLRVCGRKGCPDFDQVQAIRFAAGLSNSSDTLPAQKADIINLSLGGPGLSQSVQEAFTAVRNAGVIVVAASGNANNAVLSYPASYDGVISVAATDFNGNRSYYSTFGTKVDVAAPGGDLKADVNGDGKPDGVLSALVDDSSGTRKPTYSFSQGTSMAAPHMAGVLALMKAVHPSLSPDEVDTLLAAGDITNEAGAAGRDDQFGHGIIDALKAVRAAQALAAGGAAPADRPLFVATPSSVNLGSGSSATLIISNQGSSASVNSVSDDANWLSVTETTVDANKLGTYTLTANRTGLSDSSYAGKVTFNLSTGSTLEVRVSLVMGTNPTTGNVGKQFILLLDPISGDTIKQATIVEGSNGVSTYEFLDVSQGAYQVVGGSDVDNDSFVCQLGESCGGYPILNALSDVVVTNQNITGLDFVVNLLSNLGLANSSSLNVDGSLNSNDRPVGIAKKRSVKAINTEN
jgi:serine protease